MGKINWRAGDVGTASAMNQPFYVQSGMVSGGNLVLQISAGRMRFPFQGRTVVFPGAQSLQLNAVPVSTLYSLFLTGRGAIVASGHSGFVLMPDCPEPNGEYIGSVFTGNPVSTANLVGPWNMAASGHHETRGEYTAVTPSRPRLMEDQSYPRGGLAITQLALTSKAALPLDGDPTAGAVLAQARVGQPAGTYPLVHGSVIWAPSGALTAANNGYMPSGLLNVGVALAVTRGSTVEYLALDQRQYVTPQDPDGSGVTHCQRVLSSFSAVLTTSGADDFQAYALQASVNSNFSDTSVGARVYGYSFIVEAAKARRPT